MRKQFFGYTIIAFISITMITAGCKKHHLDNISPVVTVTGANPYFIQKNDVWHDPGATAYDNVDGVIPANTSDPVNTAVVGPYNVTYTSIDNAGNRASYTRTVYVVDISGYYSNVLDVSPYPGGTSSTYSTYSDTMHLKADGSGIITVNTFGDYANGKVYFNLDSAISLNLPSQAVVCGSPAASINFAGKGTINPTSPTVIINYTKVVNGVSIIAQSSYTR